MCTSITKLNLKNNLITDTENIYFLSSLTELKLLNLSNNPLKETPEYDDIIKENIPWLEVLDIDEEEDDKERDLNFENKLFNQSVSTFTSSPTSSKGKQAFNNTGSEFKPNKEYSFTFKNERLNSAYSQNLYKSFDNIISIDDEAVKVDKNQKKKEDKQSHTNNNLFKKDYTNKKLKKNDSDNSHIAPKLFSSKLRPVILKKDTKDELQSMRKSVDDEIASEIIKSLNKSTIRANKLDPLLNKYPNSEEK